MRWTLTVTTKINTQDTLLKLSFRNKMALITSLIAFIFLFPGIYLSMLTIATNGSVNAKLPHVESTILGFPQIKGTEEKHIGLKIFDTTRSILKTVHDLWQRDYYFVASMILLFSVIIPFIKGIMITYVFLSKKAETRKKVFDIIKSIGKWSMCDVFIVAIFLAYLSTGATQTENVKNVMVMGHSVQVDVLAGMHAHLQIGFWCFLTYCILSLLALQLYDPY